MKSVKELVKTIKKLRSPNGCPWDKEQTHKTLKRYLIEETYEVIDAIDNNNPMELMEELGDVLLQVVLHSQIAKEKKMFTFEQVAETINKKMISRHPHVFSNVVVKDSNEVMKNWEILKSKEKPQTSDPFKGIPRSLPALLRALKVSKKVAKEGFEWKDEKQLWSALNSELKEFQTATKKKNKKQQYEELGDLIFMIVNLSRWYKLDPEETLHFAIKKFIGRYTKVKKLAKKAKREINTMSFAELDKLWQKAKH